METGCAEGEWLIWGDKRVCGVEGDEMKTAVLCGRFAYKNQTCGGQAIDFWEQARLRSDSANHIEDFFPDWQTWLWRWKTVILCYTLLIKQFINPISFSL